MSTENLPLVISVTSCKGGSGKSLISLKLAQKLLEDKKYQVLVIDADITGTPLTKSIGSYLYPDNIFHSVTAYYKDKDSKDFKEESANYFKDYQHYLANHKSPEMQWETNQAKKPNILRLKDNCVNVYGSEFTPSQFNLESSSGILYNELYARWLLQLTKHICKDFHNKYQKQTAIIIDNSPGASSFVAKLREWLTDMGPVIGKFVTVSSLDVRDLEACVDEMKSTHDILTKKWRTADYYRSEWMQCSEGQFDKVFFQRLCECGYFFGTKDKKDKIFSFFETCSMHYCDGTLFCCNGNDVKHNEILDYYQYQALVINVAVHAYSVQEYHRGVKIA